MVLTYDLCGEGWRLYDRWVDLEELGADENMIELARKEFDRHKKGCADCHTPDFSGS